MSWLRIDDGMVENRKIIQLKRSERWTWMELLSFVARQNNGGKVSAEVTDLLKWVTPQFIARCVEIGLLDSDPQGGHKVHDWGEYNSNDASHRDRQMRYRRRKRDDDSDASVTET